METHIKDEQILKYIEKCKSDYSEKISEIRFVKDYFGTGEDKWYKIVLEPISGMIWLPIIFETRVEEIVIDDNIKSRYKIKKIK